VQIIETAMSRSRTVVLSLLVILIAGMVAYATIPKEAEPDIEIPVIYINITHDGISPEDGERLLVRPMEQELRTIEGIKEMTASAFEGGAFEVQTARRFGRADGKRSKNVALRSNAGSQPGRQRPGTDAHNNCEGS
jgi:multidrug efflux pump subunit AcrB